MTEPTTLAPFAAPPAGPGFVLPTTGPEGQPLTARDQYQHMLKNPAWARDALENGTQARQQFDDLNRRMAGDIDGTQGNPALAMEPPAKDASGYRFGFDASTSPELQTFDKSARSWLLAAGAPDSFGSSLAEHVGELGRRYSGADGIALERHQRESRATLEKIFGDQVEAKLDLAADFINAIGAKHPEFLAFLDGNSYIANDSLVVAQLIRLAEAAQSRRSAA